MKNYKKWIDRHIHDDFTNKTIFISGGHSGIGYEVSKYCLFYNMNVYWGSRNITKAQQAKDALQSIFPNAKIEIFQLDLADSSSIKKFVGQIIDAQINFDYFYNNAGVYRMNKSYTKDGIDITIGTNFVGTYLLNKLIIEYANKKQYKTKFIFTTSILAYFHKIDYSDFFLEKHYHKIKAYCYSKRATIHLCKYFQEQFPQYVFNLVHPGSTYTPLINKGYQNSFIKKAGKIFMKIFFHSPSKAALCSIFSMSDKNINNMICPRGIANISGYPKVKKIRKSLFTDYDKSIEQADKVLK